jgi:hypothetical protein
MSARAGSGDGVWLCPGRESERKDNKSANIKLPPSSPSPGRRRASETSVAVQARQAIRAIQG